jgi:hypothetical protein
MLLSHRQNAGKNHKIEVANRSFENVAHFRHLGTMVTDQNLIEEKIKRILNSGNACYHSIRNLLSCRLLSKNVKIRTFKTIILRMVLCGCETWSPTLREEHRLRAFENRVLGRISGLKRDEVIGGWRKLQNEELHNLYSSSSIIRMIKSRRMRWAGYGGEDECTYDFSWKAGKKETTRKTKT